MSSRLTKFMMQTRIKVDPTLAERWDLDARCNGDHTIKQQIAQAKRTATALQKATAQFSNIRPEQELALKAAASAMRSLASELAPMAAWAKAYKAFCDAEYKRERLEALEAIAEARWGADENALQFEVNLVQELSTRDGKLAFAQWLHATGGHTDVALDNISCCIDGLKAGSSLREQLAATIDEDRRATDNKWSGMRGPAVICGWRTYERYLAHRKDVASRTSALLAGMSTSRQR